jgi:glyoxylase-like metal-dependent hydrolase (beta-lactamase superfamily II)
MKSAHKSARVLELVSKEIAPDIHVVIGGSFPFCNTLVLLGDDLVVVDPGCSIESLRRFLSSHNRELRNVRTVILSHIHPDHITHAARLNRLSGCRIAANEITAPLFNEKERMKEFLGFHKANPVRAPWENLINERMYGAFDEGRVDEVLKEGDRFQLDDITFRVVMTPGHLPDHMCLEIIEHNLLFASDLDCTEFGPFYGHPNSSITDFKESIVKVQNGCYGAIISGHLNEPLLRNYKSALEAYSRQFDIRDDLVYSAIEAGADSLDRITMTPIVYPSLTNPVFLYFEKWMIEHHVRSLVTNGLVEEKQGRLKST